MCYIKYAVLFCGAGLLVSLFYRPLRKLIQCIFSLALIPLKTIDEVLVKAVDKLHNKVVGSGVSFLAYFFACLMLAFGLMASLGDYLLTVFGLEVIGMGEAVIAHLKCGKNNLTGAMVLALFLVVGQWIFSFFDKNRREQIRQEERTPSDNRIPRKRISWFMLSFIIIVIVEASLAYLRTVEIEGLGTQVPIINHVVNTVGPGISFSTQTKAAMAATITVLTSIAIALVSGNALEVGIYGIVLLVLYIVLVIVVFLRGIIWFAKKIIEGVNGVFLEILNLLNSSGTALTKGIKSLRGGKNAIHKVTIPVIILGLNLWNQGCVFSNDTSYKTEIVLILDTSGSFNHLLPKAVDKCREIIDSLPPNSELIGIRIDASSYRQYSELVHLSVPSQTERQKYAKRAKAEYDKAVNEIKQLAVDNLQKVLTTNSSPATDIWGAIAYSSTLFRDSTSKKILIVMSDFQHNTKATEDTTCSFKGIKVWALFVEHGTDSPSEYKTRIAQYKNYFIKQGALSVKFLDPIASSLLNIKELLQLGE